MTTPASSPNESSKMKKITSASVDESIRTKLPPSHSSTVDDERVVVENVPTQVSPEPVPAHTHEPAPGERRWKFLPAFWTIASILSMVVNIVLIIILLLAWQMLDQIRELGAYGTGRASGLLGGLYENFVKMDEANIEADIEVKDQIPVEFTLNVSGPTNVTTTQPVTIRGATVDVSTGGLTIRDANATIILPVGVTLPISIDNLVVPVDQDVPVELDVPVNIPLRETDLHDPFVGLQEVVRPWYCFIQPNAMIGDRRVCSPSAGPATLDPTLQDPSLRTPAPAETVIP
ncbi:MAG TPA: hypothetical protein VK897_28430 [Anaerolineales bacterium]|nr:hypothetical protein [Anaerolineales bacterium]